MNDMTDQFSLTNSVKKKDYGSKTKATSSNQSYAGIEVNDPIILERKAT